MRNDEKKEMNNYKKTKIYFNFIKRINKTEMGDVIEE